MKRLAIVVAFLLSFAFPVATVATSHVPIQERCTALTTEINKLREPADLVKLSALCKTAHNRAYEIVRQVNSCIDSGRSRADCIATYRVHDFQRPKTALTNMGYCYQGTAEVLGSWSKWVTAQWWAERWWGSDSHRTVLNNAKFDKGAGSYTGERGVNVAVYYVVNDC